jgi:DNA-binding response OmpR family regulator
MLDSLRLVLENNGYIMVGAESAEQGLKKFKQENPDLIIADLMMEEVDAGTGLVKELKLSGNKAPVYMLSSVGDQLNMNVNYDDLGLTGVFQKPIQPDILLKTIKSKLA